MYGQTNMRIPYEWNTFNAFKPFRRFQLRFLLLPRARGGGLRGGLNALNGLNHF